MPSEITCQIDSGLAHIEKTMNASFAPGATLAAYPLLLSVRSGAAVSMPGMMDTVLNIGMNDALVEAMITLAGNARFVRDCYRRFIQVIKSFGSRLILVLSVAPWLSSALESAVI